MTAPHLHPPALPLGELYSRDERLKNGVKDDQRVVSRSTSLGTLCVLDDFIIANIISSIVVNDGGVDARDDDTFSSQSSKCVCQRVSACVTLGRLACASHALKAFADAPDVWRAMAINTGTPVRFASDGSWKLACLRAFGMKTTTRLANVLPRFASDFLFRPWLCATTPLKDEWMQVENVLDVDVDTMTRERFEELEKKNVPVVIRRAASSWPATKKWRDEAYLAASLPDTVVGETPKKTSDFYAYMRHCHTDEAPLYLFDPLAFRRSAALADDYETPPFLPDDLFAYLGDEDSNVRPHYRWLIIGARNSGSFFHVDPNGTSAWNAVVVGEKRWVFYPPDGEPPPGVQPSEDGADVLTPISLLEWFFNYYSDAHEDRRAVRRSRLRPLECTARAGDVVFVPSGWWHSAVNTADGPTVAVTQNYCSAANVSKVLAVLDKGGRHVSGLTGDALATLGGRFCDALHEHAPDVLLCDRTRKRPRDDVGSNSAEPFRFNFSL